MTDGSWFVKAFHDTQMGCDEISQRDTQGSLYRGAGRKRRSERLKVVPYAKAMGRVFFCGPQDRGDLRTANCGLRSLLMFRQKGFGIVADFF